MTPADSSHHRNTVPAAVKGRPEWHRAILHLDMDAFFVNVHILEHPEDAGIPLAVGGKPGSRGVISSASYEARKFGVRSAMPSSRALRQCPRLKIVGSNWSLIGEKSREVMDILSDYGPVEKMSVDEAYIDLTVRSRTRSRRNEAASVRRIIFKQTRGESRFRFRQTRRMHDCLAWRRRKFLSSPICARNHGHRPTHS